jgi:DNA-3-methyladenine glycosylase II
MTNLSGASWVLPLAWSHAMLVLAAPRARLRARQHALSSNYLAPMALLSFPEPYDFELSTERYRAFGPDLANLWQDGGLHRVVGGQEVRIVGADGGVDVVPSGLAIEAVARKLLGAEFDLDAFYAFAATEPVLAELMVALRGLRPPLAVDPFETLVTSITAQQVSLFAAFAIRNRFIATFGVRATHAYAFPARERLAIAEEAELVALGFSRRKAEYVVTLARSDLDLHALASLPDDEVKAQLVAQRGIGEWTADWFLARHLARPRAWPWGDLGLRKAVAAFYGADTDVRAFGAHFDPFQNLAAHYLLTGLRVHPPGN